MNSSVNNWKVQILGAKDDLEYLADYLNKQSIELSIDPDNSDQYRYQSNMFANCNDHIEVLNIARDEFIAYQSYLNLTRDTAQLVKLGAVYLLDESGSKTIYSDFNEAVKLCDEILTITKIDASGKLEELATTDFDFEKIIRLSKTDLAVTHALRLLTADDYKTWSGLYRIYEVIRKDVGGENSIVKSGWQSKSELSSFTHSANSAAASGDAARHATEVTTPPKSPMGITDAWPFIKSLIQKWISSKS